MSGLLAWSLFVFAGTYPATTVPFIAGAAVLAVAARARPVSTETRSLDLAVLLLLAAVGLQIVPMPPTIVARLSPAADSVESALMLRSPDAGATHSLSIDPNATLYDLALAASMAGLFWVARQLLIDGGLRTITRSVALMGLAVSLVAIAQRATSPELLYWTWKPVDAAARPFGPFVNRNHFATWLLLAIPLTVGHMAAHIQARRDAGGRPAPYLPAALRALDSGVIWLALPAGVMVLTLFITLSRSGLVGLAAAIAYGAWLARGRLTRRDRAWILAAALTMGFVLAAYANLSSLFGRLDSTVAEGVGGRRAIWRDTVAIISDFWLTGSGLGTYQRAMLIYQTGDRSVYFNQAHNQYLQLTAEGGLVVAVPALLAVIALVALARRRLLAEHSAVYWIRAGAATGLIAVAVQSLWETGLRMPANMALFAVTAAIAVHAPRRAHHRHHHAERHHEAAEEAAPEGGDT